MMWVEEPFDKDEIKEAIGLFCCMVLAFVILGAVALYYLGWF